MRSCRYCRAYKGSSCRGECPDICRQESVDSFKALFGCKNASACYQVCDVQLSDFRRQLAAAHGPDGKEPRFQLNIHDSCWRKSKAININNCMPYELFSQFRGLPTADVLWIKETWTWAASFEALKTLEPLLGTNWYNVDNGNNRGIVRVIGQLELLYTHSRPASMKMVLTKASHSGIGGMSNQLLISFGSSS